MKRTEAAELRALATATLGTGGRITHADELARRVLALVPAITEAPPDFRCTGCGSADVQASYPTWCDPNADFDPVDVDAEADAQDTWCNACEAHFTLRARPSSGFADIPGDDGEGDADPFGEGEAAS